MTKQQIISNAIDQAIKEKNLSAETTRKTFQEMMRGETTDAQIGSLITALRAKGETGEEIRGAAQSLKEAAVTIDPRNRPLLDIVGTGGDEKNTFNISTASALVAAGAGATVAKHGNRSVSSSSGSADVLETLGVHIDTTPAENRRILENAGIAFLFATKHHPAMKHAIGPRKEIGIRTVFNVLGPLTNPARAEHLLIGAYAEGVAQKLARALTGLEVDRAAVVHGSGFDEISPCGPTTVYHVRGTDLNRNVLQPEQFGFEPCTETELTVRGPSESADTIRGLLQGDIRDGRRNAVLLNAGFGLFVDGRASSPEEGIKKAEESIGSGAALEVLQKLVSVSNQFSE